MTLCGLCDGPSVLRCLTCGCGVCARHAVPGHASCLACADGATAAAA